MHRLQHGEHRRLFAAIEIVDVEHDPVTGGHGPVPASQGAVGALDQIRQPLDVAPHQGQEAELLLVVIAARAVFDEGLEQQQAGEIGELLLRIALALFEGGALFEAMVELLGAAREGTRSLRRVRLMACELLQDRRARRHQLCSRVLRLRQELIALRLELLLDFLETRLLY